MRSGGVGHATPLSSRISQVEAPYLRSSATNKVVIHTATVNSGQPLNPMDSFTAPTFVAADEL